MKRKIQETNNNNLFYTDLFPGKCHGVIMDSRDIGFLCLLENKAYRFTFFHQFKIYFWCFFCHLYVPWYLGNGHQKVCLCILVCLCETCLKFDINWLISSISFNEKKLVKVAAQIMTSKKIHCNWPMVKFIVASH